MKLKNNAGRALGVPSAHGHLIVDPKGSTDINPADLEAIKRNKTASSWLRTGLISVGEGGKNEKPSEPKKETEKPVPQGEGVVVEHQSKGWYKVFVAGIEVSQGNLRKKDAEALAAQYETDDEEA